MGEREVDGREKFESVIFENIFCATEVLNASVVYFYGMMNKLSLTVFIALLISFNTKAQTPIISSIKLGNLKLGSSIDTVNKYLDNKITLKELPSADMYISDTIYTSYRGADVRLIFNCYLNEAKKIITELVSVYSESKVVTTKSGIKFGDNKYDIIRKLEGSYLYVYPDEKKRKEYSTITLIDQTTYARLVFYFKDNMLYAIECTNEGGDEC